MRPRKPLPRSTVPISKKSARIRRKPFPDAKDKREPIAVRVLDDGREIINMLTAEGRNIYKGRKWIAWFEQDGLCAICGRYVSWEECESDHIRPRSVKHDDRQENIQAVHHECNFRKGSQQNWKKGSTVNDRPVTGDAAQAEWDDQPGRRSESPFTSDRNRAPVGPVDGDKEVADAPSPRN